MTHKNLHANVAPTILRSKTLRRRKVHKRRRPQEHGPMTRSKMSTISEHSWSLFKGIGTSSAGLGRQLTLPPNLHSFGRHLADLERWNLYLWEQNSGVQVLWHLLTQPAKVLQKNSLRNRNARALPDSCVKLAESLHAPRYESF